jgi:hypothetical protein
MSPLLDERFCEVQWQQQQQAAALAQVLFARFAKKFVTMNFVPRKPPNRALRPHALSVPSYASIWGQTHFQLALGLYFKVFLFHNCQFELLICAAKLTQTIRPDFFIQPNLTQIQNLRNQSDSKLGSNQIHLA